MGTVIKGQCDLGYMAITGREKMALRLKDRYLLLKSLAPEIPKKADSNHSEDTNQELQRREGSSFDLSRDLRRIRLFAHLPFSTFHNTPPRVWSLVVASARATADTIVSTSCTLTPGCVGRLTKCLVASSAWRQEPIS